MRKMIMIQMLCLLWLGTGGPVAFADGMLLPLPETASASYLAVRYHRVEARIKDGHAVTHVEQEFYNPHGFPVQGRYLFPVLPEAILSDFRATVDGKQQQVIRQDPEATNATLYAIIAQQNDPSLLQYANWETLAFDLNLPPGGSSQMTLEYEEVLAPGGGLYRYRYILSTEQYSSEPLEEVSIVVDIHGSPGLASVYSPSHAVLIEPQEPGQVRVKWEAQEVTPKKDFHLYYAPSDEGFGGGLVTGQHSGHDHFLFLFSPEVEPTQSNHLPKDIVFVMDRSGSMSGEKMEQARNALQHILGQLGEEDRFSIVAFDEHPSVLDAALLPVTERALQDARHFVNRLDADGSTDLETALQTGLEILNNGEQRGAPRLVVLLTDGLPTSGITDERAIAAMVAQANAQLEARLHLFGVGYDVNTHLLDRLAGDNGGSVTYVQPGDSLESALTGFYNRIARPVLTDVEVEFEGLQASDLYPETLPDLFHGSSLLLSGRYHSRDDTVQVRVHGWAGDERREYTYHFDPDMTADRHFVARLWATRRIGALLDQVRIEGESQALVDEIRELGLSYGLVTPYTTFVIAGQAEGAASAANMALYGSAEVNRASGQTTVMARVQNQAYQEAVQEGTATGANVVNSGPRSLAQVGGQNLDLALLQGTGKLHGTITAEWIESNIGVDRVVTFGSEEYFALAEDPEVRPFLQSGPDVVFAYKGEVIAIQNSDLQTRHPKSLDEAAGASATGSEPGEEPSHSSIAEVKPSQGLSDGVLSVFALLSSLARFLTFAAGGLLLCLVMLGAVVWHSLRPRRG